jgi:hypothetical protein
VEEFFITLLVLGRKEEGPQAFAEAITALLFAVHLLWVESIASVADRNLLCAFFLLPSIISFIATPGTVE